MVVQTVIQTWLAKQALGCMHTFADPTVPYKYASVIAENVSPRLILLTPLLLQLSHIQFAPWLPHPGGYVLCWRVMQVFLSVLSFMSDHISLSPGSWPGLSLYLAEAVLLKL